MIDYYSVYFIILNKFISISSLSYFMSSSLIFAFIWLYLIQKIERSKSAGYSAQFSVDERNSVDMRLDDDDDDVLGIQMPARMTVKHNSMSFVCNGKTPGSSHSLTRRDVLRRHQNQNTVFLRRFNWVVVSGCELRYKIFYGDPK